MKIFASEINKTIEFNKRELSSIVCALDSIDAISLNEFDEDASAAFISVDIDLQLNEDDTEIKQLSVKEYIKGAPAGENIRRTEYVEVPQSISGILDFDYVSFLRAFTEGVAFMFIAKCRYSKVIEQYEMDHVNGHEESRLYEAVEIEWDGVSNVYIMDQDDNYIDVTDFLDEDAMNVFRKISHAAAEATI